MNWPDFGESRPEAFFLDVDGTLHPGTTAFLVAQEMKRRGIVQGSFFFQAAWYAIQHRFGRLDYERLLDHALEVFKRVPLIDFERLSYEVFAKDVKPNLYPGVLDHLDAVRKAGSRLVLVSSSLKQSLEPLRIYLGAEEVIGTPMIERRGYLVARGPGPVCYGPGKLHWASQWCESRGIEMKNCAAYGDNYSDRFLMEAAGTAVAVRPRGNLNSYAKKRGWHVVK